MLFMNRTELIEAIAEKTGFARKDVEKTVKVLIGEVIEKVANKEKVQVAGLGTFEARNRAERVGKNPHTGEKLKIAAVTAPAFKAGKAHTGEKLKIAAVTAPAFKAGKAFKKAVAEKNATK